MGPQREAGGHSGQAHLRRGRQPKGWKLGGNVALEDSDPVLVTATSIEARDIWHPKVFRPCRRFSTCVEALELLGEQTSVVEIM